MAKTITNGQVKSPTSDVDLPKEVDDKGEVTEYWTVASLILAALGSAPAKTVEQMMTAQRLYEKVKEQEKAKEIVLEDADYDEMKKTCTSFAPFLGKGTLFVNFFKALDAAK